MRWAALALLLAGCSGYVEEAEPEPMVCDVVYLGAPCSFICADCVDEESCYVALPTATDHCDFRRTR